MALEQKTMAAARGVSRRRRSLEDDVPLPARILAVVITTAFAFMCIAPLLLTISVSFTDEKALMMHGYSIIPSVFSLKAYTYIFSNAAQIFSSYGITIASTVCGVALGLLIMTLYAYAISRDYFAYKKQFTFLAFFTMLFNGGMLSSYIINTNVLHLKDTFFALILPSCISTMYILVLRSFMTTSIPASVVESAKLDGASEFKCYYRIVLPMSLPSVATVALFMTVSFWNAWYSAFLYIVNNKALVPIQLLLKRIENEIQYLAQNSASMSGGEMAILQADIPSESAKMALVVIVVIPILIAYPFFQKYFVKGITIGAVKG